MIPGARTSARAHSHRGRRPRTAFAPTAGEVEAIVRRAFPKADVTYKVDEKRAGIVGSWPADVDDTAARLDWGLSPRYDLSAAFNEYLIPTIRKRYG